MLAVRINAWRNGCENNRAPLLENDELLPSFPMDKRDIEHAFYAGPLDSASLLLSLPRTDRKMAHIDFLRRLEAASNQ
uniref:Uncharacterized protein n=1 Tax=Parascaris univalens TaxID=6257 RepID=A0A915BSY2_PARUN